MSDLTAIKSGKVLFIEIKTPKGVVSEYQKEFEKHIESAGGIYWVVRSVEELNEKLKKEGLSDMKVLF